METFRHVARRARVALSIGGDVWHYMREKPMPERTRNRLLNVRLLETETAMLAELAAAEHVSVSEWIRNVIRREHTLAFRAAPKRTRSGKKR